NNSTASLFAPVVLIKLPIQNSHISSHFKLRGFLIPPRNIPAIFVRARDATNSALRQLKALNKAAPSILPQRCPW
ncbi:uncharacterized protein EI90DRAFT_3107059, partial [Cantharellus anzutake]|uniref:uncharacterized protein n=1 Tax=Cantharellus anzutake TaxID=1750568 RepID=UPI0019063202